MKRKLEAMARKDKTNLFVSLRLVWAAAALAFCLALVPGLAEAGKRGGGHGGGGYGGGWGGHKHRVLFPPAVPKAENGGWGRGKHGWHRKSGWRRHGWGQWRDRRGAGYGGYWNRSGIAYLEGGYGYGYAPGPAIAQPPYPQLLGGPPSDTPSVQSDPMVVKPAVSIFVKCRPARKRIDGVWTSGKACRQKVRQW